MQHFHNYVRDHVTIFRTLSIDIWKFKIANLSEISNFSSSSFWEKPLWNLKLLLLTATARCSSYTLVRPVPTLSCFPFFNKLFWNFINFRHQNKNSVVETRINQLSKKKKKLRISCAWTLKILYTNKQILT